jgi:Fungal specific transcription factor domain
MDTLNPYISQLDPDLHTFSYIRQKSPFLLSSILAASAKMFNPTLYKSLYQHADDLFVESFRAGTKSTETVQAIMIMTYWKQPEDTRSWVNLGYAIRICMDLGWHKLSSRVIRQRGDMTEKQLRETRNVERTWFVLFVYDRRWVINI